MSMFIIFSCLGKVMPGEELLKKGKSDLLNYLSTEILDIEESNSENLLSIAIERLGNEEHLIYVLWNKGITQFDPSCFCRSKELNIDVVEFIFSKINEEEKIKSFINLIQNKEMLNRDKIDLLKKILRRDLVDIEECNKQGVLDVAIEHLEDNIGIIKLWEKGVNQFDPSCFCRAKKLDIKVLEFIFSKINEEVKVKCFKNIICNEETDEYLKPDLLSKVLEKTTLDTKLCNEENILGLILIHLYREEDLIERLWKEGIVEFDPFSLSKSRILSLDLSKFIFDDINRDKLILCLENIIKNRDIASQKKEDIVEEILKREDLSIEKCNEMGILGVALGPLEINQQILNNLWKKGIRKFNFVKMINEGKRISCNSIKFLFPKLEEGEILDIFSKLILAEEIEDYEKIGLITTMLEEFLHLKKQTGILFLLSDLEGEEILELLKTAFSNNSDVNIPDFLLNNMSKEQAEEAFKTLKSLLYL